MYSVKTTNYTLVFSDLQAYREAQKTPVLHLMTGFADVVYHKERGFVKVRNNDAAALNIALRDTEVKPKLSPKEDLLAKISSKLSTPTMYTDALTFEKDVSALLDNYEITLKEPKCGCGGWGCSDCCSSEAEIRAKQGTFG